MAIDDSLLPLLELSQPTLELFISLCLFFQMYVHRLALASHLFQPSFHVLIFHVQGLDARFRGLRFVEVLIDLGRL